MELAGQGELRLRDSSGGQVRLSDGSGERVSLRERSDGQDGYAMATLLIGMALMSLFMSVALPAWSQLAQREKEEEYLFRANQYALAVARCQHKRQCGANAPAPSVDFLVEQRFLRKKYKDPLSAKDKDGKEKDFVPVLFNQAIPGGSNQAGQAGQTTGNQNQPGRPGQQAPPQQSSLATAPKSLATDTLRITQSADGVEGPRPLTGVTSSSKAQALRTFKGQLTTYDQWAVTAPDVGLHLGGRSVGSRFAATQGGQGPQNPQNPNPQNPQGPNPFGGGNGPGGGGFGGSGGFGGGGQGTPVLPQLPTGFGQKPPQ